MKEKGYHLPKREDMTGPSNRSKYSMYDLFSYISIFRADLMYSKYISSIDCLGHQSNTQYYLRKIWKFVASGGVHLV